MSRIDVMGLGPFLKELEQRLDKLGKDDLARILIEHGKTIPAAGRRGFVAMFASIPPAAPAPATVNDRMLIDDIRHFLKDLENGKYYEGTGFDEEIRDYRSYGDESWVEEIDDLFDRAGKVFLTGNRSIAAEAYGLLLHAFDLDEEDGHFCGATSAQEMVATDISEAKARCLRALYETTPAEQRPQRLLEEMHALRYRGSSETGIKAVIEADMTPLPDWNAFLKAWIELLRRRDPEEDNLILLEMSGRLLREAVLLKDGLDGLAKLADEHGAQDPDIFRDWLEALIKSGRQEEARTVARRAMNVVKKPAAQAWFAEQWALLVDNNTDCLEARRVAWRSEPTVARLLALNTVNNPSPEESNRRMTEEAALWQAGKLALNGRLASILLILAGQYEKAVNLMAGSKPLGWSSYEHPGSVTYPFVLLALAGRQTIAKGSVLSLWQKELSASDQLGEPFPETAMVGNGPNSGAGLWAAMESVLEHKPLTDAQRRSFLDTARKVMLARVKSIANARHRGAYDRAARMLAGWVETSRLAGSATEAEHVLDKVTKDYSRLSALRREINALLGRRKENTHA
jgi:hypothetical protein